MKISDVVGYDEIASRDKSEFKQEFIVRVGEFRSQSQVDSIMPAPLALYVDDIVDCRLGNSKLTCLPLSDGLILKRERN